MTHTEYMRIWRQKNRIRYREITNKAVRKWRTAHPDLVLIRGKIYDDTAKFGGLRLLVLKRDKKCLVCETKKTLTVDHIDGNRKHNVFSNLQTLCLACHGHKDGIRGWMWKNGKAFRRKSNEKTTT